MLLYATKELAIDGMERPPGCGALRPEASTRWGEVLAISTTFALASAVCASGSLASFSGRQPAAYWATDNKLPSGSLNHTTRAPLGARHTPRAS